MRVEKHLQKRQYQTATGEWRTVYHAIFTDWKGVKRTFPIGGSLDDARDELGRLKTLNKGRYDWDAKKEERKKAKIKAMTVAEWLPRYLELCKAMPSWKTKKAQCAHLQRLLGSLTLPEASNRVRMIEYKNRRLSEPLMRQKKPVKGTKVMGSTVNREVSCFIHALNLAADEGLCKPPPRMKKERETPRERTLTDGEYKKLLDASPRWLQRVDVGANETAFDQAVLLGLTWDCVQPGLIVVKGGRAKTGARQRVGISPALAEVLDELRGEFRRTPNTERRVFTKDAKSIPKATLRHAFDKAVKTPRSRIFNFGTSGIARAHAGRRMGYHLRWPRRASVTSCAASRGGT